MDKERFDKGLLKRRQVLGEAYVDSAMARASDFSREFQTFITEYCWGAAWGDETLDARTRSIVNVAMIAALNRMHEWELHFRGALRNGLTLDELRALITQITIYCGVPVGVECHRIAEKVLKEQGGSVAK